MENPQRKRRGPAPQYTQCMYIEETVSKAFDFNLRNAIRGETFVGGGES